MAMNVRDVMTALKVCNVRLRSGASGLENPVTGINIIESQHILKILTGGEVLITSLYPWMLLPYEPWEFCEILAKTGVSALAIKVGNSFDEIPAEVLQVGEKYQVPIIELPPDSNFSNIIHLVILALYDKNSLKLQTHEMVFEQLSAIILEGEGLERLIGAFASVLGKRVLLVNRYEKVIADSENELGSYPLKREEFEPWLLDKQIKGYRIWIRDDKKGLYHLILPIYPLKEQKVFLVMEGFEEEITDVEQSIIEDGMKMISIELLKRTSILEVENRFRYDLLDMIVSGEKLDETAIREKTEQSGWDFYGNFMVVIAETGGDIRDGRKDGAAYVLADYISNVPEIKITYYMRVRSSVLYIILQEEDAQRLKMAADELCRNLQSYARKNLSDQVRIGLGGVADRMELIHRSYHEAQEAISIGKTTGKNYTDFSRLGVMKILYNATNRQMLEEAVPESIRKLCRYDRENKSTLLKSLQVYFSVNCNASRAAEELFIHYKTMLYRLEKIKNVTGLNLEDSEERLEAEVGLKILALFKNKIES